MTDLKTFAHQGAGYHGKKDEMRDKAVSLLASDKVKLSPTQIPRVFANEKTNSIPIYQHDLIGQNPKGK